MVLQPARLLVYTRQKDFNSVTAHYDRETHSNQVFVVLKLPISKRRTIDLAANVSMPKVFSTQELEHKTKPLLASLSKSHYLQGVDYISHVIYCPSRFGGICHAVKA